MDAVLQQLTASGIEATDDAGAFFPQPVATLVGLPTLTSRGLATSTFAVPVTIVSADPLNSRTIVDRLFSIADACAYALNVNQYRPSSFQGSVNAEPLPAIELTATVTITNQEV